MLETLLVIFIMTILLILSLPACTMAGKRPVQLVINEIVLLQYQAIIDDEKVEYNDYDTEIWFNRKGNINQANTYYIEEINVIVSLGTGRVYEKP